MKKFVAVPAIIALVLVLSLNVQATAPLVDDIPDIKMIYGQPGVTDIFDLDDYVVDYDDGDAGVNWSSVASGFEVDSPTTTIDGDHSVSITALSISDYGTITWTAEDTPDSGTPQITNIDSVVTYSNFWLTRPSLTAALFAYDDTSIEVQPVYIVRGATTTYSGASLLDGSGLATADWTVNMRSLLDSTTYPLASGLSNYGLNVAINADGTFTLDSADGLSDTLEIGFRATQSGPGTPPKDEWSGARVIAAEDILPRSSNSGDILKEHCFENLTATELPSGALPTADPPVNFMDESDDYGWTAYYADADFLDYSGYGATNAAPCTVVDISGQGLPEGSPGGPLPWGSCLEMEFPEASGNLIYSAQYDYPEEGDTICCEFWVSTDIPESASRERPLFRGGFSTVDPTHEISEFEAKDGKGSPLPLEGEGWSKIQVYYTAQVNTSLTSPNLNHFRVIFFAIRSPKDSSDTYHVYLDNIAVYKVKPPVDVTNYKSDPMVWADDLAYGATAIGMGDYPNDDELDGTFERDPSDSEATPQNPAGLNLNGLYDISSNVVGTGFNTLTPDDYFCDVVTSATNYTYSQTAGKSLKIQMDADAFDYEGSNLSVISLTNVVPCDLAGQGINGPGYYAMTFWVACDAVSYYRSTGTGPYGHIPTLRYGIYDSANDDPNVSWVISKQTSASAMPVSSDGWKKFRLILAASNNDVRGLMLAYYVIGGGLQGSADALYIDDITFHKIDDAANYYDDSLFN